MFTVGNKVWYPHRGCRHLVLPYRIYNDSINLDSKSFGIPGHFTRDVPETGTNTDELFIEEAKFVDIGTNVDTGNSEYLFIGTIGTNVDRYNQRSGNQEDARGDIYIDSHIDNEVGSRYGKEVEVVKSLNDVDPKIGKIVPSGFTKSSKSAEILTGKLTEMVSNTLDKTNFKTTTGAVASISSNDMVIDSDIDLNGTESEADISDTETTFSLSIDSFHFFPDNQSVPNDEANGSGDTELNINKASNSCTYLAFWNSNNCNNVSESEMSNYLEETRDNFRESPATLPKLKSTQFFQSAVNDHWIFENQGEYIIIRGGQGYGHVVKNPNWSPEHSRKPERWARFISWSCRLCSVGMLILFGYCVYGKYRDTCLYE